MPGRGNQLVSRQIPALFNGVSQQPATLRLPSQAEAQVNGYGTVADGLRKRPPSQHLARISPSSLANAHLHTINRDVSERYVVVVTDGNLQVFDEDGAAQTVNFPLGTTYLDTPTADVRDSFALVSIADYTFVVNKTKTVATKTAPSSLPVDWNEWFIPPRYRISTVSDNPLVQDVYFNNTASGSYQGVKQTFSDLPDSNDSPPPNENDIWKVVGFDENSFGSFYVIRQGGAWVETHEPGDSIGFDENTMPWALVREADGQFYFRPFAWNVRGFGDDESNPPPSFVGNTLSDVFFYKNRLGFVTDENVVFSGAGDFGNFWRTTVTQLLDSDVVDVAVSSTKVSLLRYAVPFNNNMMLFADQTQFSLNVDQLLTPKSVSIDTVTGYEMSLDVRPVPIGNDVYFVTESGNFSRVREYFVDDGETNSTDAADITAHVPRYLPKGIIKMAGNANEDVLFALSSQEPNRIYCYKFFWNQDGKAQSSWSYWEFPSTDTILTIEALDNELYVVVDRAEGAFLEKMNLQSGATTGDLAYEVLLDRGTSVTGSYVGGGDYTEFTLPYEVEAANQPGFQLVKGSDFTGGVLSLVDPSTLTWIDSTTVRATGDVSAGEVWIGQSYDMEYQFSEQFVLDGSEAITTGRLQLRTFVIYFTDTAFFETSVAPYGNDPLIEEIVPSALSEFTGKTLGASSLILGEPVFHTGQYAFQVYGNSRVAEVKLRNPTHVQCKFQSAEWEGLYHNRARVI
ncbi:MAG: hypothetical protein AAFX41_10430 [Bacteroidota bacterium]